MGGGAPFEEEAALVEGGPEFQVISLGILVADVLARPVSSLPETLAFMEEMELRRGRSADA